MCPQWWIYKTVHSAKSLSTFRTRLKTQLPLARSKFTPKFILCCSTLLLCWEKNYIDDVASNFASKQSRKQVKNPHVKLRVNFTHFSFVTSVTFPMY